MRSGPTETDRTAETVAIAAVGVALQVIVLASLLFAWRIGLNDFSTEVAPAYRALFAGHLVGFFKGAPGYVGSLVLRAPVALLVNALGGSMRSVYFWTSLPCLGVAPVLGIWLARRAGSDTGHVGSISSVSPLVLSAGNPVVILAILGGHPEEVFGAVLCVASVVLAYDGKAALAGLTIGLAVANKPWALVAVPVVLTVLPDRRWRSLAWMLIPTGVVLGPALVIRLTAAGASVTAASLGGSVGSLLLPTTLLWWFGRGSWVLHEAHLIIICAAIGCSAAWWFSRRRASESTGYLRRALLLLALVMLLRSALDPWDNLYYHLPFLFAVMAYEAGRPAIWTAILTALTLVAASSFLHLQPDIHALVYALFALPTAAWLAVRAYRSRAVGTLCIVPAAETTGAVNRLSRVSSGPMNG